MFASYLASILSLQEKRASSGLQSIPDGGLFTQERVAGRRQQKQKIHIFVVIYEQGCDRATYHFGERSGRSVATSKGHTVSLSQ
jgi:hypothetical protein